MLQFTLVSSFARSIGDGKSNEITVCRFRRSETERVDVAADAKTIWQSSKQSMNFKRIENCVQPGGKKRFDFDVEACQFW